MSTREGLPVRLWNALMRGGWGTADHELDTARIAYALHTRQRLGRGIGKQGYVQLQAWLAARPDPGLPRGMFTITGGAVQMANRPENLALLAQLSQVDYPVYPVLVGLLLHATPLTVDETARLTGAGVTPPVGVIVRATLEHIQGQLQLPPPDWRGVWDWLLAERYVQVVDLPDIHLGGVQFFTEPRLYVITIAQGGDSWES